MESVKKTNTWKASLQGLQTGFVFQRYPRCNFHSAHIKMCVFGFPFLNLEWSLTSPGSDTRSFQHWWTESSQLLSGSLRMLFLDPDSMLWGKPTTKGPGQNWVFQLMFPTEVQPIVSHRPKNTGMNDPLDVSRPQGSGSPPIFKSSQLRFQISGSRKMVGILCWLYPL